MHRSPAEQDVDDELLRLRQDLARLRSSPSNQVAALSPPRFKQSPPSEQRRRQFESPVKRGKQPLQGSGSNGYPFQVALGDLQDELRGTAEQYAEELAEQKRRTDVLWKHYLAGEVRQEQRPDTNALSELNTRVTRLEEEVKPRLRAVEEQAQAVSREVLRLGGLVERLGARELPELMDKCAHFEEARLQVNDLHANVTTHANVLDQQVNKVGELTRNIEGCRLELERGAARQAALHDTTARTSITVDSLKDQVQRQEVVIQKFGRGAPAPSNYQTEGGYSPYNPGNHTQTPLSPPGNYTQTPPSPGNYTQTPLSPPVRDRYVGSPQALSPQIQGGDVRTFNMDDAGAGVGSFSGGRDDVRDKEIARLKQELNLTRRAEALGMPQNSASLAGPAKRMSMRMAAAEQQSSKSQMAAVAKNNAAGMPTEPGEPSFQPVSVWVKKRDHSALLAPLGLGWVKRWVTVKGCKMEWYNTQNDPGSPGQRGTFDFSKIDQGGYNVELKDGNVTLCTPGSWHDCDIKPTGSDGEGDFNRLTVALEKSIQYGIDSSRWNAWKAYLKKGDDPNAEAEEDEDSD